MLFTLQLLMSEILQMAIELAENGFPVAPITAHLWNKGSAGITLQKDTGVFANIVYTQI